MRTVETISEDFATYLPRVFPLAWVQFTHGFPNGFISHSSRKEFSFNRLSSKGDVPVSTEDDVSLVYEDGTKLSSSICKHSISLVNSSASSDVELLLLPCENTT